MNSTRKLLFIILSMAVMIPLGATYAQGPPPANVNVINTPDVNVVNVPDVNVVGTPGVTVENDELNPVPVQVKAFQRQPFKNAFALT